jgi:hypothetical protein
MAFLCFFLASIDYLEKAQRWLLYTSSGFMVAMWGIVLWASFVDASFPNAFPKFSSEDVM